MTMNQETTGYFAEGFAGGEAYLIITILVAFKQVHQYNFYQF